MHKIANTTELTRELERLLDYVGSHQPSRTVLASELRELSMRLASPAMERARANKKVRFPEGAMSELEWVQRFADKVEPYKKSAYDFYDRGKFNRMDRDQDEYMAELEEKAKKQLYRAWKGGTFYDITAYTYNAFKDKIG